VVPAVPRLLGGIVDAHVAAGLQDDVVRLVRVAVGLELGDVDGLATVADLRGGTDVLIFKYFRQYTIYIAI
jgi:hypothetical protein